jgi:hypothetical protein
MQAYRLRIAVCFRDGVNKRLVFASIHQAASLVALIVLVDCLRSDGIPSCGMWFAVILSGTETVCAV